MPPRVKTEALSSLQAVNKGTLLYWGCCLSSFSYDGDLCLQTNTFALSRPWSALLSFLLFVPSPMAIICNITTCGLFMAFCLFLDCRSLTFLICFAEYLGQYLVHDMLTRIC